MDARGRKIRMLAKGDERERERVQNNSSFIFTVVNHLSFMQCLFVMRGKKEKGVLISLMRLAAVF